MGKGFKYKSVSLVNLALISISLMLIGLIYLLDLYSPSSVAIGAMYAVVILYSWLLPGRMTGIGVAVLCSFFLALSFAQDAGIADKGSVEGLNFILCLLVIWVSAVLLQITKRSLHRLEDNIQEARNYSSKLESSQDRFRHLVDEIRDYAVTFLNADLEVVSWNKGAERLTQIKDSDVLNRSMSILLGGNTELCERMQEMAMTDGWCEREVWFVRADKDRFWCNLILTPMLNANCECTGYSLVIRDLSAHRRTEELEKQQLILEARNKELEQLTYALSHDLMEPLRSMESFVDEIDNRYAPTLDGNARQMLSYVKQAVVRMSEVTTGMLNYTLLGKNKRLSPVDLNELIKRVCSDNNALLRERKASVKVDRLLPIDLYADEVYVLFSELILNAITFSRSDSPPIVQVSGELVNDTYLITVSDNGQGVQAEFAERVFGLFKRLHSGDSYKGVGLGLAKCRKIMELHGGHIWLDTDVREGCRIHMSFPLRPGINVRKSLLDSFAA